ncbi:His Kinase A (phospho-acceptor) domain-containing protein [Mucilaginibacter gossypiicola]|uniref:histidine kinase n=1 Tax=Mucilaginibacter gossypiicola TaxID=551995 RepID=A0A1H8N8T8_9SPHI|nr:HAMP domain-containing sensor histidine kinase [Mucilaginibacter gossypiicola]SEO25977.1 His Kinase A (phospho-acceptor) domain-containing protein [Mucilaginibacter gossypiicola]
MKKKLKIVLVLIALSLSGIIVFQTYWSINAYRVNKKNFDANIDVAMQHALDSCKKDYFDSIRTVLVRRLSDHNVEIKIDTVRLQDIQKHFFQNEIIDTVYGQSKQKHSHAIVAKVTPPIKENDANAPLNIWISNRHSQSSNPIPSSIPIYNYYKHKVGNTATVPQVLTEMAFYTPEVASYIITILSTGDIPVLPPASSKKQDTKPLPYDSIFKNATFSMPTSYRQASVLKIKKYYTAELKKMHIYSPFNIAVTNTPTQPQSPTSSYSETTEYNYRYNAFLLFNQHNFEPLFFRATFHQAQSIVIKGMMLTLICSVLLILFTIYCFYYIVSMLKQQKRLAELKDDFINNMTHEFKTPIATITVAIEGLQKFNVSNDPDKTQRYLQTSRSELNRLNELVTKVLNVAAFENNEISLIKEKIEIDTLINEVITSEKLKAGKEVSITYTNKTGIKHVNADLLHLRNVITNLIDNAIKYSNEPASVYINLQSNANKVQLSVTDKGIGIPASHINHIFDKFHRVPTGNLHNVKGTGLGLSYVKYIVEAHKGTITVKSDINTGTEFTVTLPQNNE